MAFTKSPLRALLLLLLRRLYLRVRGLSFKERAEAGIERSRLALIDHLWDLDRGLSMVDVVRGADFGARHMILALRAGEPRRVAQGLALEAGHQAVVRPGSRRTQALLERVDRLDERLRDPRLHGHAQLVRAIRAYGAGQWKEAVALCDESVRTFQDNCTGAVWEIWTMRSFAATSLFYLGEWRDLRRRVETQAIEARDRGNVYGLTVTYMPYGVVGLLAAGDVQGARSATREVKESWSLRGFHLQHFWFLLSESLLDLHEGDGVRAWIRIQERWPPLSRSMLPRIPSVRTPSLFLRTVIALTAVDGIGGERDAMVREARGALRLLERSKHSTAVPFAMLARAALASREGRHDDAARELERASADLERRQMFAYGAAARLQLECLRSKVPPTDFLPGQAVANPVAVMRMLVPGFPLP